MRKDVIIRLISSELDNEITNTRKKIQSLFGIKPTILQATQVLAWKSKKYNIELTADRLKEILIGKGKNE